jgi:hypothetical protein
MPSPENLTNVLKFGHSRAGRRDRSESVPIIHEKWRRSREMLAPGAGDIERLKKRDLKVKLILKKVRLSGRILQMICSYFQIWRSDTNSRLLIVALLAQSLVVFSATKESLINATTRVWPEEIELSPTITVLSLNVVVMIFAFGKLSCNTLTNRLFSLGSVPFPHT